MPVALWPPVTKSPSPGHGYPLTEAPRYLRGQNMSRWHRPRSIVVLDFDDHDRASAHLWCGSTMDADVALAADAVPPGEPVCGTCQGRAVGAGQDEQLHGGPRLLFSPRMYDQPRVCPGTRPGLEVEVPNERNRARCLVCGWVGRYTGGYRGAYSWSPPRIADHPPPDPMPIDPCPFHAWQYLKVRDSKVVCGPCTSPDRWGWE